MERDNPHMETIILKVVSYYSQMVIKLEYPLKISFQMKRILHLSPFQRRRRKTIIAKKITAKITRNQNLNMRKKMKIPLTMQASIIQRIYCF
jgi:hypothetical protein